MPDKLIVNVPPYDGEYDFDLAQLFSYVEWRWIKRISGYMPLTWEEGFRGGDPDLFLSFAVIALYRAGRISKADVLATAEEIENAAVDGATISYEPEEEVEEEDPQPSSEHSSSPPDSGESTSESSELSPENKTPSDSGNHTDSDTGLESAPVTLVK